MKQITLKQLVLTNFKGIRSLTINPGPLTNVRGQNGTGKSTIFDAFTWLLFSKDSSDRTDFEIKTLDANNKPFHRLEHEVSATLDVDGQEINLRKTLREKWVTKKGQKNEVFSGHEKAYFWNDVPMKEGEYQSKIRELVDESLFKLITNTTYFNNMKWQERRQVLIRMAGEVSDSDVLDKVITITNKGTFNGLISALNQQKTLEQYGRELAAKKKKLKDEIEVIPSRIDEATRSLPEMIDYKAVEEEINSVNAKYGSGILQAESEVNEVETKLYDISVAEQEYQQQKTEKIKEVGKLRQDLARIEHNLQDKLKDKKRTRESVIQDKRRELRTLQDDKSRLLLDYTSAQKQKEEFEVSKSNLAKRWEDIQNERLVFNAEEFCCPTCKRAYEASDVEARKEEMRGNFNTDKAKRILEIETQGASAAEQVKLFSVKVSNIKADGDVINAKMDVLKGEIATLEQEDVRLTANEAQELQTLLAEDTEVKAIKDMITLRSEEIDTAREDKTSADLLAQKKTIQDRIRALRTEQNEKIKELQAQLSSKEQRNKILERIEELKSQHSNMAQELADLEGSEFAIQEFTKAKMEMVESRINQKFRIVRFKMFEEQINGGESEACTTLINGVPYSDANTASKIQAGLDIIRALTNHFGVKAPVFIDNRESVIDIPDIDVQIINLIVSAKHMKLTIEEGSAEMAMA